MKPSEDKRVRIAIICDWLVGMRGGERCLEAACQIYPEADLFTLVHIPGSVSSEIESHNIQTSYIQKLPGDIQKFRRYLPFFAHAMEQFDFDGYDCVLSFSHCVAKGSKVPVAIPHICYCQTPMRYAWYMRNEYLNMYKGLKRWAIGAVLDHLKSWDVKTSSRVTNFIANSKNVQNRIKKAYGKDSTVIYPPVDVRRFNLSENDEGYYLVVSALVPYKRVDLAVSAFSNFDRKLLVIGNGPELKRLKKIATNNVTFIDNASDVEVAEYMAKCKALLFPGEEDFGIVPVEAQACGKGVIAYGNGGVVETILPLKENSGRNEATGVFFNEQEPIALKEAIDRFERKRDKISPFSCRQNALRFDTPLFKQKLSSYICSILKSTSQ